MTDQGLIAVAGATGMIGSHLLAGLGAGGRAMPRELLASGREGKLADWLRACGAGLVVNAVGTAGNDWDVLYRANVVLAGMLARAASRAGIACVYCSSGRVFDPARPGMRTEGESPDPVDPYGRSKALGEQAVREVPDGERHGILRLPMVLGLRGRNMDGQMATRLLARAWKGQPVRVATDAFSQVVHVDGVTEAVRTLWAQGAPGGVQHLTSADHVTLFALVSRIFAGCGLEAPGKGVCADFEPEAPGPRWQLLAPGRLAACLPPQSWKTAVDRFVASLGPATLP